MAVVDVLPIEGAFAGLASARSRSSRALPACAAEAPAPACPGKKRLSAPVMPAAKRGKENADSNAPAAPAPADDACPAPRPPAPSASPRRRPRAEPGACGRAGALSLAELAAALAAIAAAPAEAEAEEAELAAFEWGAPAPAPRPALFAPVGAAQRLAARRAFCPERMFGSAAPAVLAC
eukprot:tig00021318_g20177.t1